MAVASIAGIKRVSIEALVNGNMTKADAAAIVRRIAGERGLDGYCYDATGARPSEPRRTGRMDLRLPYAVERVQPVARWLSVDASANAQPAYDEQERSV